MIWIDFAVGASFGSVLLREALARSLCISELDVEVTDCILDNSSATKFHAVVSILGGDFPLHVELYVAGDQPPNNSLKFLESLSRELNAEILTSDDSVDPYSMLLVCPNHRPRRVNLDVKSIDEHNEYRLELDDDS